MTGKRLVRSTNDRMLGGVCAGLADHLGVDSSLIRILWALSVLVAGFGILAYLILWIALPEGPTSATPRSRGAVAIAEERYARGEITADELFRIKSDLGAP